MSRAQQAARELSAFLTTGMHHSTPEGQTAIAGIVARHLQAQARDES